MVNTFKSSALLSGALLSAAASAEAVSPERLVRQAGPAVVFLTAADADGRMLQGTGFLVSPSGLIVTNKHVIDGAVRLSARLTNGRSYTATVRATDGGHDLAVVAIAGKSFPSWGSIPQV